MTDIIDAASQVLNLHASFKASPGIQTSMSDWWWECDGCSMKVAEHGTERADVIAGLATHQAEELSKVALLRAALDPCPCAACDLGLFPGYGFIPSRMSVCPNCGDKRCPKGADHSLYKCTKRNEPNQTREPK